MRCAGKMGSGPNSFACNKFGPDPISLLAAQHAFLVKGREGALRVVLALERRVGLAAVDAAELVLGKEAFRVERLDAAQRVHFLLDQAVEVPARTRLARALHVPEAEIDVPARAHRVQGEGPRVWRRADRADPLRPQADLARVELEELGGALE